MPAMALTPVTSLSALIAARIWAPVDPLVRVMTAVPSLPVTWMTASSARVVARS